MKQNKLFIYGRHAVSEALAHAPHALLKVYFDRKTADKDLKRSVEGKGITTADLSEGLARSDMKSGTPHQGVVAQVSLHALVVPFEKFITGVHATPDTSFVFLSGVEDPHNVGAIIRSAAAFGAAAILLPAKGQSPITGAVAKASSGMAFRLPLVVVENSGEAVRALKKLGFVVYGLSGEGANNIIEEKFGGPSLFIFGNEGKGIPGDLAKLCDKTLSIPMHSRTESLNVAASAAVALYSWSSKHPRALK